MMEITKRKISTTIESEKEINIFDFTDKELKIINQYDSIKNHDFKNFVYHALYLINDYVEWGEENQIKFEDFETVKVYFTLFDNDYSTIDKMLLYYILEYFTTITKSKYRTDFLSLNDVFSEYTIEKDSKIEDIFSIAIGECYCNEEIIFSYIQKYYNKQKEILEKDIITLNNFDNLFGNVDPYTALWNVSIINSETNIKNRFVYPSLDIILIELFNDFDEKDKNVIKKLLKSHIDELYIVDLLSDLDDVIYNFSKEYKMGRC